MESLRMRITLRLYAVLRETAGTSSFDIESEDTLSAHEAFERVTALSAWQGRVGFARDDEMISRDTPLSDGDVVDCLPPVSGG